MDEISFIGVAIEQLSQFKFSLVVSICRPDDGFAIEVICGGMVTVWSQPNPSQKKWALRPTFHTYRN